MMLNFLIDKIVNYCLCADIVSTDNVPWLRYGIEQRISTLFILIPFFLFSLVFTDFWGASAFLVAFYLLKKKTGGIHAKTVSVCVFTSLLLEIAFLAGLYPHLSMPILFGVNLVSTLLIFLFAPYNHPNMWLSDVEIRELRNRSRKTVIYEQCCIVVSWLMGYFSIARGLTTGVAMAAFLLSLAYINDWRKIYERKKRGNTQVH